jgi:signal transduction histidine kinase
MMKKKIAWSLVIFLASAGIAVGNGAFRFLFSANYLPHRYCYLAQPGLVWTNVAMDGLIAASYLAIFIALFWMAGKLRHLPDLKSYLWIFFAFGSFIVACGLTHVMEIVTVWWPVYPLSAAAKVVCALASVPTAILFVYAVPTLARSVESFLVVLSTTQQEKDQALASLLSSEKLAVAGKISATIAHEIKSPLDSVGNLLYLIRTDNSFPAAMLPYLESAEQEVERAGKIARSTLSLYREASAPVATALGPLVESVVELQSADLLRSRIHVERRIDAPVEISAYPGELRQILINIIQNAAAAIDGDGVIIIRVRPARGGYSITVADNGPGVDPANREKLFNLFFTTKGEQGTGLGLWLVRSLVEKHGGDIRFRSRTASESAKHGTLFNLWLPLNSHTMPASPLFAAD